MRMDGLEVKGGRESVRAYDLEESTDAGSPAVKRGG